MVEIDGSERRHKDAVVRNGIRGVRAPAHADFENDDVQLGRLEQNQSSRREGLEACCADFTCKLTPPTTRRVSLYRLSATDSPFIMVESRTDIRCGLLNLPTVTPLVCSIYATNDKVLPFPLVPVI